jgi:hypothetical protein
MGSRVVITLLQRNLLRARKTAGEKLARGHGLRIRFLSRSRKSLHRPKHLGHPLGIVGEENGNLRANDLLARASANRALLPGNRASTSLQDKLIQVLAPHELHHLLAQGKLASPKVLQLGLKDAGLIV